MKLIANNMGIKLNSSRNGRTASSTHPKKNLKRRFTMEKLKEIKGGGGEAFLFLRGECT